MIDIKQALKESTPKEDDFSGLVGCREMTTTKLNNGDFEIKWIDGNGIVEKTKTIPEKEWNARDVYINSVYK